MGLPWPSPLATLVLYTYMHMAVHAAAMLTS